jgi:putative oxidoreductase
MKTLIIITRILTGLLYMSSALMYFFKLMPEPELTGNTRQFIMGLAMSGYFMPLLKTIEFTGGLALLIGRYSSLAVVVLFPITLNIFLFHLFLAPEDMVVPVLLLAANLFLAFAYRDRYKPILAA